MAVLIVSGGWSTGMVTAGRPTLGPEKKGPYRTARYYGGDVSKLMSKSEIVQKIAEQLPNKITREDIKGVLDALADVGRAELKQTGAFLVPGFAKFEVTGKPATEAREGVNPFTKEPMTFKAKPASKVVRARPIKALKDAL
jgi:DNA-binding protein HU-beta